VLLADEKSMVYGNDMWISTKLSSQGEGTGRRATRTLFSPYDQLTAPRNPNNDKTSEFGQTI
jgi:hypothetical protein